MKTMPPLLFILLPLIFIHFIAVWGYYFSVARPLQKVRCAKVSGAWQVVRQVLDAWSLHEIALRESARARTAYHPGEKMLVMSRFDYQSNSFLSVGRALARLIYVLPHMRGNAWLYADAFFRQILPLLCGMGIVFVNLGWLGEHERAIAWGGTFLLAYVLAYGLSFFWGREIMTEFLKKLKSMNVLPENEFDLIVRYFSAAVWILPWSIIERN